MSIQLLPSESTIVLQAPPGTGKSTGLPVALLHAEPDWLEGKRIVLLQPRRAAVVAVARRIATLLGERLGARVGVPRRLLIMRHTQRPCAMRLLS